MFPILGPLTGRPGATPWHAQGRWTAACTQGAVTTLALTACGGGCSDANPRWPASPWLRPAPRHPLLPWRSRHATSCATPDARAVRGQIVRRPSPPSTGRGLPRFPREPARRPVAALTIPPATRGGRSRHMLAPAGTALPGAERRGFAQPTLHSTATSHFAASSRDGPVVPAPGAEAITQRQHPGPHDIFQPRQLDARPRIAVCQGLQRRLSADNGNLTDWQSSRRHKTPRDPVARPTSSDRRPTRSTHMVEATLNANILSQPRGTRRQYSAAGRDDRRHGPRHLLPLPTTAASC